MSHHKITIRCPTVLQITVLPCLFYFPVILSHCHFAVLSMLLFSWVFSVILWVWEKTFRSFTFQKIISVEQEHVPGCLFFSLSHIQHQQALNTSWLCQAISLSGTQITCMMQNCVCLWVCMCLCNVCLHVLMSACSSNKLR